MKINYHLHTAYSGDLIKMGRLGETPEKYAMMAEKRGFDEICFTDHLVVGYPRTMQVYSHSMKIKKIGSYIRDIALVAKKHPQLKIRAGIEMDWLPEKLDKIKEVIAKYPFDCVLGSVHSINGVLVEHEEKRKEFWGTLSDHEIYERNVAYYKAVQEMAKSGVCDVIAHLDLIKRDGYLPKRRSVSTLIEETVRIIAENGLCVEVNTSGLKKPVHEMHPSLEVLKLCRKRGIPVTIGTDAHKAGQIDFGLDEGMKLVKGAGYGELAVFERRKRNIVKI